MSGSSAKKVRKQIKSLLKDKMDNQNQDAPAYSFKHLETYIQLSVFLTGKKPEKIELVEGFYTWLQQEILFQAESMGLNPAFKDDKMSFMGVPIEKKVTIVVPDKAKLIS